MATRRRRRRTRKPGCGLRVIRVRGRGTRVMNTCTGKFVKSGKGARKTRKRSRRRRRTRR